MCNAKGKWGALKGCPSGLACDQGTQGCATNCFGIQNNCAPGRFCGPEDGLDDTACYPFKANGGECDFGSVCASGGCNVDKHVCCKLGSSPECIDFRS